MTTTLDGAQVGYNRTGRRTDADACSLRRTKRVAGRRCCRKHSGVPRNSASLLGTLHRKAMELRKKTDRERSVQNRSDNTSSSLREIPATAPSCSLYRPTSRPSCQLYSLSLSDRDPLRSSRIRVITPADSYSSLAHTRDRKDCSRGLRLHLC